MPRLVRGVGDRIVYDLHGLTEDEIRIVEGAVAGMPAAPAPIEVEDD